MRSVACLTAAIGVMMVLPVVGQVVAPRDAVDSRRPAQQASSASPHLAGQVTAASDGTPLRRSVIVVTASGRVHSKVLTDNDGRFEIAVPVSVAYAVRVTKAGYLPVSLPRPSARSGTTVTLNLSLARSAVISGQVTDSRGHPVVSIRVRIERADTTGIPDVYAVTDDLGTFRVSGLATGKYSVMTIGSPEYLSVTDAMQLRAGGVEPLPWQPTSDAMIIDATVAAEYEAPLAYRDSAVILSDAPVGGVVAGQITDEAGEPAAGLTVQLFRLGGINGAPSAATSAPRMTDDRGRYRFFHVRAGRYAIIVTDEGAQTASGESSWLPIYYPGTAAPADVVTLSIDRQEELTGMDMVFTPTRGARVFGVALDAAGRPQQLPVSLITPTQEWPVAPHIRTVAVDADGGFAFENVPPGEYALRAAPSVLRTPVVAGSAPGVLFLERENVTAPSNPEFALQPLQVTDADAGPLLLRTGPPATLRGRIVFEGMPPPSVRFALQAYTTDPYFQTSPGSGTLLVSAVSIDTSNWTFEIPFVAGPIRLRLSTAPPTWWLRSAYIGGVNAAEFPVTALTAKDSRDNITLVISSTAATLTGRTMRTASQAESGAQVIVFSTNREHWFTGSPWIHRLHSSVVGGFSVAPLPPGDYWVVAVDSPVDDFGHREADWADMLDPLTSRARRVTLGDGQTLSVNPPVVSMKE